MQPAKAAAPRPAAMEAERASRPATVKKRPFRHLSIVHSS
jgi:hypothetical protein